jgi:hypothetical protein
VLGAMTNKMAVRVFKSVAGDLSRRLDCITQLGRRLFGLLTWYVAGVRCRCIQSCSARGACVCPPVCGCLLSAVC